MVTLKVNGKPIEVNAALDTPLLWLLRDYLQLTATKFGCGAGHCGVCSVMVNDTLVRSCTVTLSSLDNAEVVTLEGLESDPVVSLITAAWIAEQVPQCGYCAPGMIMATTALLRRTPHPNDIEIDNAITNLCRCGSYPRVRKAIHRAAAAAP
ncbi:MAG: (2Fe-2S)-binding protein [Rhodospirillaceae bacterium]